MTNTPLTHTLDRRGIGLLAMGHLLNDINQGAVSALLPFLIAERGLNYTSASGVVLAATLISGILQPTLGIISDRHPIPWMMPLGMLLGGLGLAMSGLLPDYSFILIAMLISGAGVAAFHPESYRFANYTSRGQRGRGMSIFSVGGNLGFAIGPAFITLAVMAMGLTGTWVMVVPAAIYAAVLWLELPRFNTFRPKIVAGKKIAADAVTDWSAFIRLTVVIILRTVLAYGVAAFAPLYLIKERGMPTADANFHLTLIAIAGAMGTLLAGAWSDRFGRKRILLGAMTFLTPLLFIFVNTDGLIATLALTMFGMASSAVFTVSVVMGQEYAAANLGVATGVTTGAAIGIGGLAAPIFGRVADLYGLPVLLWVFVLLPLLALGLALTLPRPHSKPS
jgi:FSR family fosmidomycin resistance protein-like MFS transporter